MVRLVAGIDDLGTETQKIEGSAYFIVEEEILDDFNKKAGAILAKTKLKSFHGKEYKRKYKQQYQDFLMLIKDTAMDSQISLAGVFLLDENWKAAFQGFGQRVSTTALKANGIENEQLVEAIRKVSPALFQLLRETQNMGVENTIRVEIDHDGKTRGMELLDGQLPGIPLSGATLVRMVYNGYRNVQFKSAPVMQDDGFRVVQDENSFIVQAADILANFSNAYIYKKLGKSSKANDAKAEIFEAVFGQEYKNVKFEANVEMLGEGDMKLTFNGQQALRFGRYE